MIIVCSSPRSGGNWLLKELSSVGIPLGKEYLSKDSKDFVKDLKEQDDFCIKIHPSEIGFNEVAFENIFNALSGQKKAHIVWLERKDISQQAESLAGARLTGHWFDGSTRNIVKPSVSDINEIEIEKMFWKPVLDGKEYYKLTYEDMVEDIDREVKALLKFLERQL